MIWALATLCLLSCIVYLRGAIRAPQFRCFEREPATEPSSWPKLSIVIAARDEAETISTAISSLLAQNYPGLEIIVADDRSTDGTGAILESLPVQVVHISELPAGWLGKVHALSRAFLSSTGELLLFTDADVRFAPGALRRAVSSMQSRALDHLTILPRQNAFGFFGALLEQAAAGLLIAATRPGSLENSRRFLGIGAFNLVRRSVFDRTPGLEWLKLEVLDDMGLAMMMRQAGGKPAAYFSRGDISLDWYRSPLRGLEKVFLAGANYSPAKLFVQALGLMSLAAAPFIALLPGLDLWVRLFGAAALLLILIRAAAVARTGRGTFVRAALEPLSQIVLSAAMIRAAFIGLVRRKLVWRGTEYTFAELRAGRRLPAGKLRY